MKQLKTPMKPDENIVISPQIGTLMTGLRENGYLAITNQRVIWEKATAMNILGRLYTREPVGARKLSLHREAYRNKLSARIRRSRNAASYFFVKIQ